MLRLAFYRGEKAFEHPLISPYITIGRGLDRDIRLLHPSISREHCAIRQRGESWELVETSSGGTRLNNTHIRDQVVSLSEGDTLTIGDFTIIVESAPDELPLTRPVAPRLHEALVSQAGSLTAAQAVLTAVDGPDEGRRWPLKHHMLTIGGPGSSILLSEPGLKPRHGQLMVTMGRVCLRPGAGAMFLGNQRIDFPTPLYPAETFQIGRTRLRMGVETRDLPEAASFGEMVGRSPKTRALFSRLRRIAAHDIWVLITGETGTGKELVARGIHQHSSRQDSRFVALNCGALPETLLESELFGYEKGAFSGATQQKDGLFHRAHSGTLFLDEIGELSLSGQAALLRVLDSGEVRRVGGHETTRVDVRILAATNRDLSSLAAQGRFRADLLHRLKGLHVTLLPLRERRADLKLLIEHLLTTRHPGTTLTQAAHAALMVYSWPGNVRELRNTLRTAVLDSDGVIDLEHLAHSIPLTIDHGDNIEDERVRIRQIMARTRGNRAAAARILGLTGNGLKYRMEKLGLA